MLRDRQLLAIHISCYVVFEDNVILYTNQHLQAFEREPYNKE